LLRDQAERAPPVAGAPADQGADPVIRLVLTYLIRWDQRGLIGWLSKLWDVNLRASARRPSEWFDTRRAETLASMFMDPHQALHAVAVDPQPPREISELLASAGKVLTRAGVGYSRLASGVLRTPEVKPPLFLVGRQLGPLMARPPKGVGALARRLRPAVLLNRDHPQLALLLQLHRHHPGLAAYTLAKDLLLVEDRLLALDGRLMAAARDLGARKRGS
jgi:hypothetical protein